MDVLSGLTKEQAQKFESLYNMLIEWNKAVNLTAITDKNEVYIKHFADSLTAQELIERDCNVLDIGTGAGFPSLPLAIARPDLSIVALDSVNKKLDFVRYAAKALDLRVQAVHSRVEDLKTREFYSVVLSRAVAPLNTLLEYALPFTRVGGIFIAYKSLNVNNELENAQNALKILGAELIERKDIDLCANARTLLVFKKHNSTPKQYPRALNKPKKAPL